jgi:hypothetical protein
LFLLKSVYVDLTGKIHKPPACTKGSAISCKQWWLYKHHNVTFSCMVCRLWKWQLKILQHIKLFYRSITTAYNSLSPYTVLWCSSSYIHCKLINFVFQIFLLFLSWNVCWLHILHCSDYPPFI